MGKREIERNRAAKRGSDHMGLLNTEVPQKHSRIFMKGKRPGKNLRLAIGMLIVANGPILLSKNRKLFIPHPVICDASMDQKQRWTLTGNFIIQGSSLHIQEASV